MNEQHHDLNDLWRVLVDIRTLLESSDSSTRLDKISRQLSRSNSLSAKILAEMVTQPAILTSIDTKITPRDVIGATTGKLTFTPEGE